LGGDHILTKKIIEDVTEIVKIPAVSSQPPNCNSILQQWEDNKKGLYNFLNGNLVLKYPVNISLSSQQEEEGKDFLLKKTAAPFDDIIRQIDTKSLVKNSLQNNLRINEHIYPKGMKVSKVFNKLLSETNEKSNLAILYSQILQTFSAKGNLCISIHPVDFLTMGDNGCGWGYCHSLQGEFRAGLLSLLTDNCTAVCYLESSVPFHLQSDKMNRSVEATNKKWRQLIHVNLTDEFIIFNTQYPYEHDLLFHNLVNKLELLFKKECYLTFLSTKKTDLMELIDDYDCSPEEPLHYNDLLIRNTKGEYENNFVPILSSSTDFKNKGKILVGNTPYCPICGERLVFVHKSMECHICNPLEYCCTCATPFHNEELHNIDSEFYCDTCFDNEFTYCEKCDEIVRRTWIDNHHSCNKKAAMF
jgi:hypothetical protein